MSTDYESVLSILLANDLTIYKLRYNPNYSIYKETTVIERAVILIYLNLIPWFRHSIHGQDRMKQATHGLHTLQQKTHEYQQY